MIEVQCIVFLSLLWASWQDLKSHRVSDLVWIVGGSVSLMVSLFLYAVNGLPSMVFQALLLLGLGFLLHFFSSFGMADVFALGLIGFSVPGPRFLTVGAIVLCISIVYQRIYSSYTGKIAVPLMPGITLGYLILVVLPF